MEEWQDERYSCDNCGYNGPGEYINFVPIRGHLSPVCLCEECYKDMRVWNEE